MKSSIRLLLPMLFFSGSAVFAADYDASIDFSPRYELSLPVSGIVKTLNVAAGQLVKQGDELLALDQMPFKSAKTYAQSRVTVQQTLLTESKRDLQQQQDLYDRTLLALVDLENAQLREKRDSANLDHAQAELADANYALTYSKLIAPFDALILSVQVNPGQSINNALQSKTLISLVRQNHYQAKFYVAADEAAKININQAVTVKSGGKQYDGNISSINYLPLENESVQAKPFMISASFLMEAQAFNIGKFASVHID